MDSAVSGICVCFLGHIDYPCDAFGGFDRLGHASETVEVSVLIQVGEANTTKTSTVVFSATTSGDAKMSGG